MLRHSAPAPQEAGFALFTTVIFALVVLVAGVAFFSLASYESKAAIYRENSSEAFYLADGAVERLRAKFLEDRTWRAGWVSQAAGRGAYDLAVTDTTYLGQPDVIYALATGYVDNAKRTVDVMAAVPPTAFGLGILILGDADVKGNLCLAGNVHVVGVGDFGPGDIHLACGGTHTQGFDIVPPPIYTDPGHYPNATYYYVIGNVIAGAPQARILDASGIDITTSLGDSLTTVTSYNVGQNEFTFDFNSDAEITKYFDDATGIFKRAPGDQAVVVNFGEASLTSPLSTAEVEFDGGISTTVNATVINTRFTGTTVLERTDTNFWVGGLTTVRQIIFEPYHGIALIVHDFEKQGGALSQVGTTTWPAFVYVTQDVVGANSNLTIIGAITALGDWSTTGGPNITFDEGFLLNFPQYLIQTWTTGVSGTLKILRWREIAAGP